MFIQEPIRLRAIYIELRRGWTIVLVFFFSLLNFIYLCEFFDEINVFSVQSVPSKRWKKIVTAKHDNNKKSDYKQPKQQRNTICIDQYSLSIANQPKA